jgi:hypothetical protein
MNSLTEAQAKWLLEYLKGQREVNAESMDTEELERLDEVIAALEAE